RRLVIARGRKAGEPEENAHSSCCARSSAAATPSTLDIVRVPESLISCGNTKGGCVMPAATDRITKTPNVCGGEARIPGTRITLWGLVNQRRLGATDAEILRAVQGLTPADLGSAWEYTAVNAEEIDRAIRDNEEGEEGLVE